MKEYHYLFFFLFIIVFVTVAYALTPEEILLLKRSGVSDEKILEIQKKEASFPPQPAPKINPFDWNEDGKKDIISGSDRGRVYVYLNTGTNKEPVFDKATEIYDVEIMRFSKPYIVDWDNDGKKDFVIGSSSGEISLFLNKGTNLKPRYGFETKLNDGDLDVGNASSPAMVDWNGDGKKDLIVGDRRGRVHVFLNKGTDSAPSFSSEGIKTSIEVPNRATPFIVDWDNDGKFDVICGSSDGKVYIFINKGDSKNPKFYGKSQTLQVNNKELKLSSSTSVIAVGWDDDGKTDLLVSNKGEVEEGPAPDRKNIVPLGIYLLFNTGTKEKPEFKELKPIKGKFREDTVL
jgi:WD40 repeat protein